MRATERLNLLEQIGTVLQTKYTYDDIDIFFEALGIPLVPKEVGGTNSKRVYAKAVLGRVSEPVLLKVARELELVAPGPTPVGVEPPANWKDTTGLRLFISHISKDKEKATRLKEALSWHFIDGFVAHEDINPTLAWQEEVERALHTMDALVAVHTAGFSESNWTQQEVGFALGRGVKVISFKMGEDPTGFIGKHQALPRRNRTAEEVAKEIDKLLAADPRTSTRLREARNAPPF